MNFARVQGRWGRRLAGISARCLLRVRHPRKKHRNDLMYVYSRIQVHIFRICIDECVEIHTHTCTTCTRISIALSRTMVTCGRLRTLMYWESVPELLFIYPILYVEPSLSRLYVGQNCNNSQHKEGSNDTGTSQDTRLRGEF